MKMDPRSSLQIAGLTVLAPISWGTTYVVVTELLPAGRPLLASAGRVLPAGLLLVAVGVVRARWRPRGAQWWQIASLATLNFALFFPLLITAAQRIPGGVAAAAGGLQPLLVLTLSWLLGGQRPRPLDVAVGGAAAVGVALVVLGPAADLDMLGVAAALGAALSFALGVVLTRRFPSPGHRLAATGWQLLMSSVVLVPLALAVEGPPPELSQRHLIGLAYFSLVATGAAFMLWFDGVQRLPVATPPLLGLAAPVTGAALGWVVLGESLSTVQLSGFAITIAAIVHGALLGGRPTPVPPARAGCARPSRPAPCPAAA